MTRRKILLGLAAFCATAAPIAAQTTIPTKIVRSVAHTRGYGGGLAFDRTTETIWIGDAFNSAIDQYDPYTGTIVKTINAPNSNVRDLTFDGLDLWMASWISPPAPSIFRLDTSSGNVLGSFVAPFTNGKSNGMAYDGLDYWIGEEANRIHRCGVAGNVLQIVQTHAVPATGSFNPRGLAWDTNANQVWAGYQSAGLIRKHDAQTGNPLEEFASPYGNFQQGLAWDGHFLWATGGSSNKTMSQIDVTAPFLELLGQLSPNTTIQFQMTAASGQAGNVMVVGWSVSGTTGFTLGNATIPLTFDGATQLGLALINSFSATIDASGQATTPVFNWPALPAGIPFWVCAVTFDNQGVVSVTEPFKYLTQP